MPKHAEDVPIPSCSALPNLEFGVGTYSPALEFSASIKNKPSFENKELYFTHTISSITKEYATGKTVEAFSNKKTKNNDSYGFNLVIPGFSANLPSFTIPNWPTINEGCNECIDDEWPPLCAWENKSIKKCKKILGKKICVNIPFYQPTKCINEIVFKPKTLPSVDFFNFKKTEIAFSFSIIPDIEVDTVMSLGATSGGSITIGDKPEIDTGTPIVNFAINTCKIGLKIRIDKLKLTYGGQGINITNITIPIISTIDLFPGEKCLISEADAMGNLKLWYLIKSSYFSLYQILNVGLDVVDTVEGKIGVVEGEVESLTGTTIPKVGNLLNHILSFNTPEIIINFLKQTNLNIACGMLICPLPRPDELVYLSFVTSVWTTLSPFKNLNAIKIPSIPEKYTNLPSIPSSNYIPDNVTDMINKSIKKATQIPLDLAAKEIVYIADYIKNNIENVEISVVASLPIPLIPKKPPAV